MSKRKIIKQLNINIMNSKEKILEEFDDRFGIYWSNYKNTLFRCNPNDILDKPSVITSECLQIYIIND